MNGHFFDGNSYIVKFILAKLELSDVFQVRT